MKIKFIDVGRNKVTWESECPVNSVYELEYDWLFSQVKNRGGVMSNDIEFLLEKASETEGIITAGFHTIGKFEIRKEDAQ